jgi:hypothetical protein
MIVLPAAQVLHQSSDGMAPRVVAKASGESDVACAVVACSVVRVMPLLLSLIALFPFLKLCERGKEKEIKFSVL